MSPSSRDAAIAGAGFRSDTAASIQMRSDSFVVRCGNCGAEVSLREGERVRCPRCGAVVYEPEPDEPLKGYQ